MAGRNAQGCWGDFWGACDLQIEIGILIFAVSVRHAVPCLRQGRRIQLKALWGGHTAALQFMPCIQFPIGEGKHAIRRRRLHEDEIVTACTAGNSTEMVLICLYVGLPKHVLHELSLLKYRVRRAFLHKMRPDAMQKSEISIRSHTIKQTMLNIASDKGL